MSIHIRDKDDKHFVGNLNIGKFFVHEDTVYMVMEYNSWVIPTTAVSKLNSFGGTTLPSKTRVRVVVMVEGVFE